MAYRILRQGDHPSVPWRNGGGSTLQVAQEPEGSATSEFDWRLSFASITRSGPFSSFPGIDRVIVLVRGETVRLVTEADTGRRVHLLERFEPHAFAGEDRVTSEISSPSVDFNVMTRRGTHVAQVEILRGGEAIQAPAQGMIFVAVLRGQVRLDDGSVLEPLDVLTDAGHVRLVPASGDAVVALVTITAREPRPRR